jgi:hypothetical protein
LFALAQIICGWLWLLLSPANAVTQLPLNVPLRFGSDKFVELAVELTRYRFYQVDLVFPFENAERRATAKRLAGEPTQNCEPLKDCGVTPSFLVTIRRGADVVLREEKTPVGIYAFSASGFYRKISATRLKPARYDITVEVVRSPAELIDYHAFIQFTTDARAADLKD